MFSRFGTIASVSDGLTEIDIQSVQLRVRTRDKTWRTCTYRWSGCSQGSYKYILFTRSLDVPRSRLLYWSAGSLQWPIDKYMQIQTCEWKEVDDMSWDVAARERTRCEPTSVKSDDWAKQRQSLASSLMSQVIPYQQQQQQQL